MSEIPDDLDWSFDPDYGGYPTWWHEGCPTPTVLDDGSQIGGVAHEERVNGHLVAIHCEDCDAVKSVNRRPTNDRDKAEQMIADAYGLPVWILRMTDAQFYRWLHETPEGRAILDASREDT